MRVLWLTNTVAPYRVPIWDALSASAELTVVVMRETLPNRSWRSSVLAAHLDLHVANAPMLNLAEDVHLFFPNRRLERVMRRPCDVVILDGWDSPAYQYAFWRARRRHCRVILFYQSTISSRRFHRGPAAVVRRRMFRHADAIVTSGESSARAVLLDGVAANKVHVAFNPIDVAAFRLPQGMSGVKQTEGHTFLFAGQLIERKNPEAVIRAFKSVRTGFDRLLVVGAGPLAEYLTQLVKELDLEAAVEFLGHLEQSEVAELMHVRAQTVVMPSVREVYGLVAAEGLAAGLHSVVSHNSGIASVVEGMPGTFLVDPELASLCHGMRLSRASWRGRITNPPILAYTADVFAQLVLSVAKG